ncbi:MAG: hypothetical protein ABJL44_00150 [Algibacter sp.]
MKKIVPLLIILVAFACNKEEPDTTAPEITILGDNPLTITQYTEIH